MREIRPVKHLDAAVSVPGSKSITHRYLIMTALAAGRSRLLNALWCADTRYTAAALQKLGAGFSRRDDMVEVIGVGGRLLCPPEPIFLDNAGTAMRLLTAVVCLGRGNYLLVGNDRMHQRPVGELLEALGALGAKVESVRQNGCPPVRIRAGGLRGGATRVDASRSSQFVSALLLAAPYAAGRVEIEVKGLVSRPYVDVTLEAMKRLGAEADWVGENRLRVEAPGGYRSGTYEVEGDCSSASYFWASAAVTGGRVKTVNIRRHSRQGDIAFLEILRRMGCRVDWDEDGVSVSGGPLRGITVDMNDMPDMVPTLAVVAAYARGSTIITNVAHLRLKESDRLQAIAEGLQRMKVEVEQRPDCLVIKGGHPRGALIDPHDDHRIAMSFAVAGLVSEGVRIAGESCVDKSFPRFWQSFEQLYGQAPGSGNR